MTLQTQRGAKRARTGALLVATLALVLSGCGDDEKPSETDEPADDASLRKSLALVKVSPLTGLPVDGLPEHPVMVVKIDNTGSATPQVGLKDADLVVEQLVEGGSTRLAAFFHSKTPTAVGPVRSMRDTDIGIVSPVGANLVASGGAEGTANRIDKADITYFTEGAAGFSRDSSRSAPYNLMLNLKELAKKTELGDPPENYLPFDDSGLSGAKPAKNLTAAFSSGSGTRWEFSGGSYHRSNAPTDAKADFVADTVLTLSVEVEDAGYLDPAGNTVPESVLEGEGDAQIFHDGKTVTGTWAKKDLESPLKLTDGNGDDLTVPAGRTWIELVPRSGGSVNFSK